MLWYTPDIFYHFGRTVSRVLGCRFVRSNQSPVGPKIYLIRNRYGRPSTGELDSSGYVSLVCGASTAYRLIDQGRNLSNSGIIRRSYGVFA
jgi:hypothetical protein